MQKNRLKLFSGDNNESKCKHTNKMNGTIETSIVRIKHTDEKKMFIVEIRKRRRIHKKRNDLFFSLFILCVRWNCDYLFVCWRWKRRVIDENEREKWGKKQQILESLVSCFSVEIESSGCGTNRKKIWWSFTSAHKTPLLKRYAQKKKLWCATTKKSEKDRLLLSKLRCMFFFFFILSCPFVSLRQQLFPVERRHKIRTESLSIR